jgi:DNA sulfur modification protein DndC
VRAKRDPRRMNGNEGNGPLLTSARRELLAKLLALQEETGLRLISPEELLLIQQMWKAARNPDDGRGVARIDSKLRGGIMNADLDELSRLREIEEEVAREKGINVETLRRMVAKVDEYSEYHRAVGLPDALMNNLKDDLERPAAASKN